MQNRYCLPETPNFGRRSMLTVTIVNLSDRDDDDADRDDDDDEKDDDDDNVDEDN